MNTATFCPEDDRIRIYVGRVPRDEYLRLKAEGWTSTPKQTCDFVATWTPQRRDTALEYADLIEDEDQSPEDRAADRAERFGGYLDKRLGEAVGHADRYESGPSVHGFQSQSRGERAAARHDRIGSRAVDAWSKAEYWTRRTAGVISNALYKSSPGVRMGRIKTIEADLRQHEAAHAKWSETWTAWKKLSEMTDPAEQTRIVHQFTGSCSGGIYDFKHPRPETISNPHVRENGSSLYTLMGLVEREYGTEDLTGAEACALWLSRYPNEPQAETEWMQHYKLRLAYENQMLEAQGGRAAHVEMIVGGFLGGRQIHRVNKSPVTNRVVSVLVQDNHPSRCNHYGNPYPDGITKVLSHTIETERLAVDAYRAPTDEELAAFLASKKAAKAAAPKKDACPLINPTDADAERLIEMWNAVRLEEHEKRNIYSSQSARALHTSQFKPCEIRKMPQSFYSENSKGSYAQAETKKLCSLGRLEERNQFYDYSGQAQRAKEKGPALCQLRTTGYDPLHLIILTDKPQKALPASVWVAAPVAETVTA